MSAVGHRKAFLAIGTLARAIDHVGMRMEIRRVDSRMRYQREQLRSLASCIVVLTDELVGRPIDDAEET